MVARFGKRCYFLAYMFDNANTAHAKWRGGWRSMAVSNDCQNAYLNIFVWLSKEVRLYYIIMCLVTFLMLGVKVLVYGMSNCPGKGRVSG